MSPRHNERGAPSWAGLEFGTKGDVMGESKTTGKRAGRNKAASSSKTSGGGLIPANPLPARTAFIQIVLLLGIPALLLLLARYVLVHFFPSMGY